jgi:hypothetical protein
LIYWEKTFLTFLLFCPTSLQDNIDQNSKAKKVIDSFTRRGYFLGTYWSYATPMGLLWYNGVSVLYVPYSCSYLIDVIKSYSFKIIHQNTYTSVFLAWIRQKESTCKLFYYIDILQVLTQICLLLWLFYFCLTLIMLCCAALHSVHPLYSFLVTTNANIAMPFCSKNLGLSKVNAVVSKLLFTILRAADHVKLTQKK